ncbi:MAG: M23 family metallopeptidase [Negativicutes bacterium]|nr:M23 family metallopeptidase [Negativicutes bacterium]
MARNWNEPWKNPRWDARDPWQHREKQTRYGWLKRLAVAVVLFALVFGAHESDTMVGRSITAGVQYVLTTETDFAYLADKLANALPKNVDMSVWKRVQSTVTKPADPLQYMTKPVSGRVVTPYGWRTDPVTKQEKMSEGIGIEASTGLPVRAAAAGKVRAVTDSAQYGRTLIIEHSSEIDSVYGYLGEVLVAPEEMVSQGQIVARVGKAASTASPLLYFEVREKGKAIDPLTRIRGDASSKEGK